MGTDDEDRSSDREPRARSDAPRASEEGAPEPTASSEADELFKLLWRRLPSTDMVGFAASIEMGDRVAGMTRLEAIDTLIREVSGSTLFRALGEFLEPSQEPPGDLVEASQEPSVPAGGGPSPEPAPSSSAEPEEPGARPASDPSAAHAPEPARPRQRPASEAAQEAGPDPTTLLRQLQFSRRGQEGLDALPGDEPERPWWARLGERNGAVVLGVVVFLLGIVANAPSWKRGSPRPPAAPARVEGGATPSAGRPSGDVTRRPPARVERRPGPPGAPPPQRRPSPPAAPTTRAAAWPATPPPLAVASARATPAAPRAPRPVAPAVHGGPGAPAGLPVTPPARVTGGAPALEVPGSLRVALPPEQVLEDRAPRGRAAQVSQHLGDAAARLSNGRLEDALASYQQVLDLPESRALDLDELRAGMARVMVALADDALDQGDSLRAMHQARAAAAYSPELPQAFRVLAVALERLGAYAEAVEAYGEALARREDPELRLQLAYALRVLGRIGEARGQLDRARRLGATPHPGLEVLMSLGPGGGPQR